ncbi:MAG: excinuclease ABC subunit A, partial [Deltaproteobacteria bacterium]|nr:excinuclease ABC subunit A [Deltaproteobacteria bacterium]
GVLYIIDEPSIGLHPRDIEMLTQQIKKLAKRGNTVVVVEHDHSVIKSTEYTIELGPGSGEMGGRLVYQGKTKKFLKEARTLTAEYIRGERSITTPRWRRSGSGSFIKISGATGNNLADVDLEIPVKALTCVTGVSGSGKSSLILDTLYNALAPNFKIKSENALPYTSLTGVNLIEGLKLIDQNPIGKTPRSNPVTYIGAFDEIRKLYSQQRAAIGLSLGPGHFSFNVTGGRCESCMGEGVEKLEMYFLPDVYTKCSSCGGKRFKPQVLDVKLKGRNISDVLNMTFDEAHTFFKGMGKGLSQKLALLGEVGLGYLKLGQSATSLSGGEAQRLKIARELATD